MKLSKHRKGDNNIPCSIPTLPPHYPTPKQPVLTARYVSSTSSSPSKHTHTCTRERKFFIFKIEWAISCYLLFSFNPSWVSFQVNRHRSNSILLIAMSYSIEWNHVSVFHHFPIGEHSPCFQFCFVSSHSYIYVAMYWCFYFYRLDYQKWDCRIEVWAYNLNRYWQTWKSWKILASWGWLPGKPYNF